MSTIAATPATHSSYRNCPVSELSSRTAGKSRSKGKSTNGSSSQSSTDDHEESAFTKAQYWFQQRQEWLLSYICIIAMILSISFYSSSFSNSNTMIISNIGDGQNIAYATLGYQQLCFIPQYLSTDDNITYITLPEECTLNGINHQCEFELSSFAQNFQSTNYNGHIDSHLSNCTEFNAYRAFHVMGFIFSIICLLLMIISQFNFTWLKVRGYNHYIKINALLMSFASGGFGVAAQCILIDWMNWNQKNLVSLSYETFATGAGVTMPTVVLGQSAFYEVGGWVCAFGAFILYIAHFPSALAK